MYGALTRIDTRLSAVFDDETTSASRRRSRAARLLASAVVTLTGIALLTPNITPLIVGGQPLFGVVLSVVGSVVCVGLAVSGYLLYRSRFSTANAVRISVWNLLGVVVLGTVLWMHSAYQGVLGATGVGGALTAGNVLAISAAAHVIIGVHDARRVRAEQLARERKKLAVLNRALRHNLRNEATVLLGHGERLADGIDDPNLAESARLVADRAETVGTLADKAKQVIETFEREEGVRTPREAGAMVDRVVESVAADGDVPIDVSVPDDCWLWADECYETALTELVENAVDHGQPPVAVAVTVDGDWVRTRVSDGGTGIPDQESAVVSGESEITPLTHASGMGLWLAQSAVEANGGELTFAERDDETVVTMSHRRADGRAN
jgi:signal transduction histidine kinase